MGRQRFWGFPWCAACISPAKSCQVQLSFCFPAAKKSSPALSPVHWLVCAWLQGPQCARIFKHALLLLLDTAGKQPDQLALDTAEGYTHTDTKTHTTHHLAWITNHQLNDCSFQWDVTVHVADVKVVERHPCVQTWHAKRDDLCGVLSVKTFKETPITDVGIQMGLSRYNDKHNTSWCITRLKYTGRKMGSEQARWLLWYSSRNYSLCHCLLNDTCNWNICCLLPGFIDSWWNKFYVPNAIH